MEMMEEMVDSTSGCSGSYSCGAGACAGADLAGWSVIVSAVSSSSVQGGDRSGKCRSKPQKTEEGGPENERSMR